jgi:alpha-N-arabinofuranosidase
MYTAVKGDTILPVNTDSGSYNVKGGVRPLDDVADIPYIDVVATRSADGSKVTLLCVNRSLNQDVPVNFDLGNRHAIAAAEVEQISATNRYEQNDEVEPVQIVPIPGSIAKPGAGPLVITLPHESVTVIRVPVE